jgi:hypothetical protein
MKASLTTALVLTLLATACSLARAAQKIDLQFRPAPADKQTLRVTSVLNLSYKMGPQQQEMTNTKTLTLAFEPIEIAGDGTVLVRVRFLAIREQSGMKGAGQAFGYDSTKPLDDTDPIGGHYSAFIGESVPAKLSPKGEVLELGTDELFLAVAENIMQREDRMMRERLKERAERAIERTDQRFGSREKRKQALKKQAEEFPIFDKNKIRGLLSSLIVRFPKDPVQNGDSWRAPITVDPGMPLEMAAVHTLKAVKPGVCTIEVTGRRTMEDKPIVSRVGPAQSSTRLAGSYTATVNVDPKTGLLLGKQAQMKFAGEAQTPGPAPQTPPGTMQVTMEGTTTVEVVK